MTETPEDANQSRVANTSLAAHNRRYRDDVVRIGSVPHAQKETENNDGEQSDHLFSDCGGTSRLYRI
jgi:hypothetical protein